MTSTAQALRELASELGITAEDNPDEYAELRRCLAADRKAGR